MRIGFKAKRIIKIVAFALAGVAAITAVAFGVKAIVDYTKNDLKEINPSFEVGSLGSDGKYVADEGSLYTKEAFGCYGLQVKPDFDSTVNYQLYYYDILDNFVSSSEVLSEGYSADVPVNGAYARMVITPRDDEDGKIGSIEKIKYSNQITVKVRKEQNVNERFGVYRGKVLQVVSNPNDLVFTSGITLSDVEMLWNNNSYYCATSICILKVECGSTLNIDFSSCTGSDGNLNCRAFQFSDIPFDEHIIPFNKETCISNESIILSRQTRYVILCVENTVTNSYWDEVTLAEVPLCFSVTKSK